jgi:hypothetical protein
VRTGILMTHVMDVVGADDLEIELFGDLEQAGDDFALLGDAVVLDFDEEVFPAEDVDEPGGGLPGLLEAVVKQMLWHNRCQTTRESDQAAGVTGERLVIGARFIIKPFQVRVGHQFEQVLVALEVFREQAEVVVALAVLGPAVLFQTRLFGQINLAADQGLNAFAFGGIVELNGTEHVAMISEGHGLHAQGGGAVHQAIDPTGAVQQAVVGVDVEMDEIGGGGRHAIQATPAAAFGKR